MSTKTRPDGGALTLILDRWISNVQSETAAESGLDTNDPSSGKPWNEKSTKSSEHCMKWCTGSTLPDC